MIKEDIHIELTVENLGKRIRGKVILDGISVRIHRGITVIVGHNGSGKSSLLRCIAGIWTPTGGIISYQGQPSIPRRKLGYLIDPPSFYESFTARDMLRYYVSVAGETWDESRYNTLSQEWQIPRGKVKTFSRGQRQRLGIICSMWHNPDLWLLDEPFTGLDSVGAGMLWETMLSYVREGDRSVVMVLHDGHGLPEAVSQVIEISQSTLSFVGPPAKYFCAVLERRGGLVPLHWQPVLAANRVEYALAGSQLRITDQLDSVEMATRLIAAGLNPLSLIEGSDSVEV